MKVIAIIQHKDSFFVARNKENRIHFFFEVPVTALGDSVAYKYLKGANKKFHIDEEIDKINFLKEIPYYDSKDDKTKIIYHIELSDITHEKIRSEIKKGDNQDFDTAVWITKEEVKKGKVEIENKEFRLEWFDGQKEIFIDLLLLVNNEPFDNFFIESVKRIQKARDNGNLVVFVGAGVSNNSGVPLWGELIDKLKAKMNLEYDEKDDLIIPQLFFNERLPLEYHQQIQEILGHNKVKPNPINQAIIRLKANHIITTNYDNLFEQALEKESIKYSVVKKDSDLPHANTSNLLIKMHGDFDERNIVLKEDDYLNYEDNFPLISNFVKGVFSSKLVLFIGFSFNDNNLKYIFERIRNVLKDDFQPAYLFTLDNLSNQKKQYLKNKGILTLEYNKKISQFLLDIDEYSNDVTIGNKTLNFVKFVENYSPFRSRVQQKHIVDQIYESLNRFDPLLIIPPKIIAKLHPFNTIESYRNFSQEPRKESFNLKINNENIIRFIKDYNKDSEAYLNIIESVVSEAKWKVKIIFFRLKNSDITNFKRPGERQAENRIGSFNFGIDAKISYTANQLREWNFQNTLKVLKDEPSSKYVQYHRLILANTLFYVGNYLDCFKMLKVVINQAWNEGEYVLYYVALLNTTKLKWRIYHNQDKQKGKYKQILKEIDLFKIDLYKSLNELPVDQTIKDVLNYLKEDRFLEDQYAKIKDTTTKVVKLYNDYKNDWFDQLKGSAHLWKQREHFYMLWKFYHFNNLFPPDIKLYNDAVLLSFEGLLASFCISERYRYRLKSFNNLLIIKFIEELKPGDLLAIIDKYLPKNKQLIIDNIEGLVKQIHNLLHSSFSHSSFLGQSSTYKNELFHQQQENSLEFKERCNKIYHNSLLILAYADFKDLGKKTISSLIDNLINYWKFDDAMNYLRVDYLEKFIVKKIEFFNYEQFNLIFSLLLNSSREKSLFKIINATQNIELVFELDDKNEKELFIVLCKNKEIKSKHLAYMHLLSIDHRKDFKEQIVEQLNEHFDTDLYFELVQLYNIKINEYGFFDKFIDQILKTKVYFNFIEINKNGNIDIKEDNSENQIIKWQIRYFIANLQKLITFNLKCELPKSKLKKITNLSNCPKFLKWILQPEQYDYKDFELIWLNILDEEEFKWEKLSKNKELKTTIQKLLSKDETPDPQISSIYFKYFC